MRKQLLPILVLCFIGLNAFCQNGNFRSRVSGNWSTAATWERDADSNGTYEESPSTLVPASTDGTIIIQNTHVVTVTTDLSIDQVTIESGGDLRVDVLVTLTIVNGSGTDLANNGTFTLLDDGFFDGSFLSVNANAVFSNAGTITFDNTLSQLTFGASSTYQHAQNGSSIPLSNWNSSSTCEINGVTSTVPSNLNQTFGNLTWNCTGQSSNLTLGFSGSSTSITGNFTISSTGSPTARVVTFSTSAGTALPITGNLSVSGTSRFSITTTISTVTVNVNGAYQNSSSGSCFLATTGTGILNVKGNFTQSAGTLQGNTNSQLNFNGSSAQTFTGGGTFTTINFAVTNGATLNMGTSSLTGAGTFNLNAGGTLGVGSPDGLNAGTSIGNVRVSGTRTYTANGNIIYNGSVAQNLGDEWSNTGSLNGVAVNLEIANSNSSGVTNNVIGSTSLVGNLILTSNPFHIGNSNTLIIQSNFTATGGTIGGLSSSNLTFSGSGTITGNLNFASSAQNLNNFTISRSGTIVLGTPLTIAGTLAFSSTGNLQFNGQTLTVNGNITQSGSGGLISNSSSNLVIGGTNGLTALPFSGSNQINNVTLDRTGTATYTWNGAVTVNGIFSLNSGALTHSSGLTMATGSTFSRNSGTTIAGSAPNTSTNYNVSYSGTITTGLELPSSSSALNNLTVAGDATLDKTITINGDLNINSGTLNALGFNITMAGDDFNVNAGAFTINSTSTVTFSRSGTTTLGGSAIGGTQFGNLTINSGATISAPNANLNVSGTWDNSGSFTANSSTITFNGGNQNIDGNGQPFNNVTFAGTGTKTLQGALDANGTLTITSTLDVGANNSINVAGSWTNNGTFTAAGGTVTFDGAAQTINSNGQSFFNLTLAGSGTKTLGNLIDINGALVINSSVTLDVSATAYQVNIAGNWTNNGMFNPRTGTVVFDGTTAIAGSSTTNFNNVTIGGALTASSGTSDVAGTWLYSSGSFSANGGTIRFNGGGAQSITPGGQSFNNVVIGGTNTKTLQGDIDINGNLTLSAGTFSVGTNRTVNLAGNFDASGGGIFTAASGLFIFDGAAQNITSAGEIFNNAEFSGSGTKTLLDAFDANGYMDINIALAAGSNSINVGGNWDATGGSFTTTGTTTFDGAAQNITSNGSSFGAITIAGSGTKTMQDALDANGNLTIAASSTLNIGTGNFAITVGGNWNSSAGTFAPTATSTVTLDGAAQNITLGAANNFRTLTIAGSGTKTLLDIIDINGNLTISSGTVLSAGANDIEIAGNWTNNVATGGFVSTGTVIFDGGGTSDVNGSGTTSFRSINVTGSTNVEIETTHSITGTLTLVGASSRFDADGSGGAGVFTLISSADDPTIDARIAALTTPANFIGNVTVQRFMSQESMPSQSNNRLYRYISSPVSGAAVSQIQSEIPVTGSFTGSSSCSGCGSNQSMFRYNEALGTTFDDGWVDFPDASNTETLQQGVGYGIFVRGNIIPSALWDVRGPIFSGNFNLPVTYNNVGGAGAAGFNLVGNPYPSAIDWDLIFPGTTNLANAIYIRDNANGVYAQYVGGVGSNGGSKDIAMGQAFWVEATGASPQLPITESAKSSASTVFFRAAPISDLLRIVLTKSNLKDETVIRFYKDGSDLFDVSYDARKLENAIFNLSSIQKDDRKLAINTLGLLGCGREIKLDIANVTTGSYELSFSNLESFSNQVSIKLFDAYSNQTVDVRTNSTYGFTIDVNKPGTFGTERFKMIFEFKGDTEQPKLVTKDICHGSDAVLEITDTKSDVNYAIYANGILINDAGAGTGTTLSITIPKEKLAAGENIFKLQASNTFCDQIKADKEFTIKSEVLPVVIASGNSVCLAGSVTLSASGGKEGSYRWYETFDSVKPIEGAIEDTFVTPVIPKTKTYYVSSVNSLGCEGERKEVVAQVVNYDPVTISEPETGVLVSSYSEGNQWYKDGQLLAGSTGKSITVTESGTYSVEVKIGKCSTSSQREFSVTGIGEDNSWNGSWRVYPNPVVKELIVESIEEPKEAPVLFDMTGKKLGAVSMVPVGKTWIGKYDFSGKTRGIYILQVLEKGVPKFKRIIKD